MMRLAILITALSAALPAAVADGIIPESGTATGGYDLPADCDQFMTHQDEIAAAIREQQIVNLYYGNLALCRQKAIYERSAKHAEHDFVSSFEWAEARLDHWPLIICAVGVIWDFERDYCSALRASYPDLNLAELLIFHHMFDISLTDPEATPMRIAVARSMPVGASCRPDTGSRYSPNSVSFNKWLTIEDGHAACRPRDNGGIKISFGFDRSETLYADVDEDGYMDTILIVHRRRGGTASWTEVVILSRKSMDGKLRIVEHTSEPEG